MSELTIRGSGGGEPPTAYPLDLIDRDIIRMALRGDIDMRRYLPQVMCLCARLDIREPPWIDDEVIRQRVEANREQ